MKRFLGTSRCKEGQTTPRVVQLKKSFHFIFNYYSHPLSRRRRERGLEKLISEAKRKKSVLKRVPFKEEDEKGIRNIDRSL